MQDKKLNVIIVEDEKDFANALVEDLSEFPEFHVKKIIHDEKEVYQEISNEIYDVLFLDIVLPKASTLDMLKELQKEGDRKAPYIVFVTHYKQHALEAFEVGAGDFLVKPYSFKRFKKAIQKILSYSFESKGSQTTEKNTKNLACKNGSDTVFVPFEDVLYLESFNYQTLVHTEERVYTIPKILKVVESMLDAKIFFRVHKKFVVNTKKIVSMSPIPNAKYDLNLNNKNNTKVQVGRLYVKKLKNALTNH